MPHRMGENTCKAYMSYDNSIQNLKLKNEKMIKVKNGQSVCIYTSPNKIYRCLITTWKYVC